MIDGDSPISSPLKWIKLACKVTGEKIVFDSLSLSRVLHIFSTELSHLIELSQSAFKGAVVNWNAEVEVYIPFTIPTQRIFNSKWSLDPSSYHSIHRYFLKLSISSSGKAPCKLFIDTWQIFQSLGSWKTKLLRVNNIYFYILLVKPYAQ